MNVKKGTYISFFSRVHGKDITAEVDFAGSENCIVVYDGTKYSIQRYQIKIVIPF